MIEHINVIDALYGQIIALLDLMIMCDTSTDIRSINTASEMCMTMTDDLMNEVKKIETEWRESNEKKNIS